MRHVKNPNMKLVWFFAVYKDNRHYTPELVCSTDLCCGVEHVTRDCVLLAGLQPLDGDLVTMPCYLAVLAGMDTSKASWSHYFRHRRQSKDGDLLERWDSGNKVEAWGSELDQSLGIQQQGAGLGSPQMHDKVEQQEGRAAAQKAWDLPP